MAGQFAGIAAAKHGPTGPFELSTGFLALGGLLTAFLWKENITKGSSSEDGDDSKKINNKPSIKEAIQVVKDDPKIMLVGGVQSLFEAAMYIFFILLSTHHLRKVLLFYTLSLVSLLPFVLLLFHYDLFFFRF